MSLSLENKTGRMRNDRVRGGAQGAAMVRALHQVLDDEPRILDDPISTKLFADELERYKNRPQFFPFAARVRANFLMRNRYAEDCLAESLANGVKQYVLLGAGLDTFAYRQPPWASALRIFEGDLPATQKWKRERLTTAKIDIPGNLAFVPLDLENVSLKESLAAADMDFRVPTFLSSLGVSQYLTKEAFDRTLKFVVSLPSASEIVFSFVLPSNELPLSERIVSALFASRSVARGEPWLSRFSPAALTNQLKAMGFSKVIYFSSDAANQRYFHGRRDGLQTWHVAQMMRAIV
jgi:methyltransferase (TIGR00027 family)